MHKPPLLVRYRLAGIKKIRSIFFERSKSSGIAVTQPAGWGGKTAKLKKKTKIAVHLRVKHLILIRITVLIRFINKKEVGSKLETSNIKKSDIRHKK